MSKSDSNSVFDEPCFRAGSAKADPSESKADRVLSHINAQEKSEDQQIEHSVWDEPSLGTEMRGANEKPHMTYAAWLDAKITAMTERRSWLISLAVIFSAGPWAVVGALFTGFTQIRVVSAGVILFAIVGPLTEEFMKIAIPLYIVEKRPFYFKSKLQMLLCVAAGGLMFAVIENLIYIYIYIDHPSDLIILWRWTICVLMHTTSTFIAGLGLMRMWSNSIKQRKRPELHLAYPFIVSAVIFHGLYNAFAIIIAAFYIDFS